MRGRKKRERLRWLAASLALLLAGDATIVAPRSPAEAQERQRRWTLFDLFGQPRRANREFPPPPSAPVAKSKAVARKAAPPPEPKIAEVEKAETARSVLVVGDFLGSGLAEGLFEVYAENPNVRVLDRTRGSSGFVRLDVFDWPAEIAAMIEAEKPAAVIVMMGSNDRQQLRVGETREQVLSPAWSKEYAARAALLSSALAQAKVPFLWVGLPSFKSPKMSSDILAMNEFYKEAAEEAGGTYVDIWDGFVDEQGVYIANGPDINGQPVRLRGNDGINLARAGKRKAAFYTEKPLAKILGLTAPQEGDAPVAITPEAAPGLDPNRILEIDRTPPIALTDPELDGGSELLGATVVIKSADGPLPGAAATLEGAMPLLQAGRADDFMLVGQPTAAATTRVPAADEQITSAVRGAAPTPN